jgi:hypothetical protein
MRNPVRPRRLAILGLIGAFCFTSIPATQAQYQCHSTGAPAVTTGDISATDIGQTSRMFRDGRGTTCSFNRPQTTSAGTYLEDSYTFTNTTGATACVFVDLDATGCGVATNQISMAAYLGTYNPASILTNVIADPGLSTGGSFTNSMAFSVAAGATYIIVVHDVNAATICPSYKFTRYVTNSCRQPGFDLANDGSADLAVFRPSGALSNWYSAPIGGATTTVQFGSTGDIPVGGNYTGNEGTEQAVFRPSTGTWYRSNTPANNFLAQQWGVNGDVPVQGDYDRDGITDVAVFRPSDNNWYILRSSNGTLLQFPLGAAGDKAVAADYDGDGRTDIGVWHPANGLWTVLSSAGTNGNLINAQPLFGLPTDLPVPADYDGDGKADFAVFRPSEGAWYIFRSSLTTGQVLVVPFGASGDIPQPADYDGDGKVDEAVFRPSTGVWYIHRSTTGDIGIAFGQAGDVPTTRPTIIP